MPFSHTPKKAGDTIFSKDWNEAMDEIVKLRRDKLDLSGGVLTGDLKIQGDTSANSSRNVVEIGGKIFFHAGGNSFIGWNAFYDKKTDVSLASDGFAGEIRFSPDNGALSIRPYKKGSKGSLAELINKGVTILNDSSLVVGNSLMVRGTDIILSGRSNKNGLPEPAPQCRVLVDGGNKLIINWEKDFSDGTYIVGNGNTLGLRSTKPGGHCYLEFYPDSFPYSKTDRNGNVLLDAQKNPIPLPHSSIEGGVEKGVKSFRKAYIGFENDGLKDLVIANEYVNEGSDTNLIIRASKVYFEGSKIYRRTVTAFDLYPANPSDIRLKDNIKPLRDSIKTLLRLEGVSFDWKDPEKYGKSGVGFVAQSVEKVMPNWVEEGNDGIKYLSIKGFEALVVEALRELKDEIELLKTALHTENQR